MPRLLLEARWFISLGLCLGLLAILLTYSKADPAWSHASFEAPKNLGGRFGAYLADLMLYIFGISAFWWVALFGRRVLNGWFSYLVFVLACLCSCISPGWTLLKK
jgi:S-DNA-T family DNA segregation ATPase FtsK/SpoIIIE